MIVMMTTIMIMTMKIAGSLTVILLCAWITRPERRGGRSPVGPKGCQLEVGAQTFSGDICFDMVVSEKVRQE